MSNSLIYLAGPYSAAPEAFFRLHMKYTAAIINAGHLVFSPILHCHPLAKYHALPGDYEFWKNYNHHMLELCSEVWVIRVQGWEDSRGVKGEIALALDNLITVRLVKLNEGKLTTTVWGSYLEECKQQEILPCLTSSASALTIPLT